MWEPHHCALSGHTPFTSRQPLLSDDKGEGGSRNQKAPQPGDSALAPKGVVPPGENVWKGRRGLGHRDTGGHVGAGPWPSLISPQGPPFLGPAGPAEAWARVPMLDPHSAGKPALLTTHLDGNEGDA